MDILSALGLSIPAGLNAYIPLLAVAVAQRAGWLQLREPFAMLGDWWAIGVISALLLVEIFADKIPAVDSINDGIQTVVRPAVGGLLALGRSGQAGQDFPVLMTVAGIVLAGGVHAVKAAARPTIDATTAGAGAPIVSLLEDIAALLATAIAILVPILVVGVLVLFAWLGWQLHVWSRGRGRGRGRGAPGQTSPS